MEEQKRWSWREEWSRGGWHATWHWLLVVYLMRCPSTIFPEELLPTHGVQELTRWRRRDPWLPQGGDNSHDLSESSQESVPATTSQFCWARQVLRPLLFLSNSSHPCHRHAFCAGALPRSQGGTVYSGAALVPSSWCFIEWKSTPSVCLFSIFNPKGTEAV